MAEHLRIDAGGRLIAESEEGRARLRERAGRLWLAPTSPTWLLALRGASESSADASGARAVLAGDLAGVALPDLIAFLNQSRATGLLRVSAPGSERALWFRSGEVCGAASDDPADRLGEIAVRLGLAPRERVEAALAGHPSGARSGRALVDAGVLQPHELWRCMQHQVSEIFFALLLLREGCFVLLAQEVEDRAPLSLNTQALLMDGVRRLDEMKEFRKRLPSSQSYVVRSQPAGPGLKGLERRLYDLCDGSRTVAQVAQAARLSEFEATKLLHHLIEAGLVAVNVAPRTGTASALPSGPAPEQLVRVFNTVFREVFAEVRQVGMGAEFATAAAGALASEAAKNPVLANLAFSADGALSPAQLLHNLAQLGLPPAEGTRALHSALSELMFFLLFETGELLAPRAADALSSRVKALLGSIEVRG